MKYSFHTTVLSAILLLNIVPAFNQQPNIIFITLDDQNDYTADDGGHPMVETPNLTALAELGTRFTSAYCSATQCAPSRTSMLLGKDVAYTQVYDNTTYKCKVFRANFTAAKGNEEVFTLPEFLKDYGNYYTYGINKIFHCYDNKVEYDSLTADPCSRGLSWNRLTYYEDDLINSIGDANNEGIDAFKWCRLDDTLETYMDDYVAVDTALKFIHDYAAGDVNTCGRPFFLAMGIAKPHHPLYVPEHYFLNEYYQTDFYELPYDKPYNDPPNAFPYNGVVMPPQPDPIYSDYYNLGFMGQFMSHAGIYNSFEEWREALVPMPVVDEDLPDSVRNFILEESKRANAVLAYLAAIKFADAQVGRLMDELAAHPALYNNTIIICIGDNGYSLGEKMHWRKASMWETDIRVPVVIADLRNIQPQICNTTISLLDLFPTICDMLGLEPPMFDDGSPYLDGTSLAPLLENASLKLDRPVLSTIKDSQGNQASCFPQYSVRSQRFHYIRYQSNNVEGDLDCNEALSFIEEELYDVGVNRETDPDEWNNLISNDDYAPVVDYLEEFLPGGSLYLDKPYEVEITNKDLTCFLTNATTFKFKCNFYTPEGVLLGAGGVADFEFKWWTNLTEDTLYGKTVTFNTNTIDPADFASNDKFYAYLQVHQISTGKLVAFDTKTYYINNANKPIVNFFLDNDAVLLTTDITDYTLTGSYYNTYWNFGDGSTSEEYLPSTHIYAAPGLYTVTNYIEYGNGCIKTKSRTADVLLREGVREFAFSVYPNPASTMIIVAIDEPLVNAEISMINVLGQVVYSGRIGSGVQNTQLDISQFAAGTYLIKIKSGETADYQLLEISR